MEASEMKPGMWVRFVGSGPPRDEYLVVKLDRVMDRKHPGDWVATTIGGEATEASDAYREPWAPRVGEWVRCPSLGAEASGWVDRVGPGGVVFSGGRFGASAGEVEPCLPPVHENAGRPTPEPTPVFKVGDRVRLNAEGQKRYFSLDPNTTKARTGFAVERVDDGLLYYNDGASAILVSCAQHVPTEAAPVEAPPQFCCPSSFKVGGTVTWAKHRWRITGVELALDTLSGFASLVRESDGHPGRVSLRDQGLKHARALDEAPKPAPAPPAPPPSNLHPRCPICRGPATELLVSIQCHTDPCVPWAEPEPESVREVWRGPFPDDERHFEAEGLGHRAEHPVRETAISMWRAKVRRKGAA